MYKKTVRAFALGILFSVSLIGVSTYFLEEKKEDLNLREAEKLIKESGYVILSNKEYEQLQNKNKKDVKSNEIQEGASMEQKDDPSEPEQPSNGEEADSLIHYQLEIKSGMNTEEISSILRDAKIIEDEVDFEQYLVNHDYNTKVQVGTFDLNSQMSYEVISKIITKS